MRVEGPGRALAALVGVLVVAAGCTSTVQGHGQAAAPTGSPSIGSSGLPQPAAQTWVPAVDAKTGVKFQLADQAPPRSQADTAQDGTPVEKRIYLIEINPDLAVSVTVESGVDRAVEFDDLNTLPDELVAQFQAVGVTDFEILERKQLVMQGHRALDFRISFTPLSPPAIKPMWLIRVVEDDSALVVMQTIDFPKSEGTDVESTVRALQRRLIEEMTLA